MKFRPALDKSSMQAVPPKLSPDYERTLRSANAMLYALMIVGAVACVAVAWHLRGATWCGWQRALAVGAGVLAALWGGYYALYRVRVDAVGVAVGALRMRRCDWRHLRAITVCESDEMGVAHCSMTLSFAPGGDIEISSSLLALHDVRELLAEWRAAGMRETSPCSPL